MATSVFVNEFHYDNTGADAGEFLEIAGPAGTDLTGWRIVRYNGSNGLVYTTPAATETLSGTIPDQGNGFGTVVISYPSNGFQNGAPDGFALVDNNNTVVQFLSYEGSFTAVDGVAAGLTSTDIGISQGGDEPIGASLQLTGTGSTYEDFTWVEADTNTSGAFNNSQTFVGEPVVRIPIINEFVFNHVGTDTNEYVELSGSADIDYSTFAILQVEGDAGATLGTITSVQQVGTTNGNGLWTTGFLSNGFQNGTQTLLLVENLTGTVGTDLDTNDDGTLDLTLWDSVADDVAVSDNGAGDRTYSTTVLTPGYDGSTFIPGGASRIPNGVDTNSVNDWVRNDFDLAGIQTGTPELGEALNTPGAQNQEVTRGDVTPISATISQIQGAAHVSPLLNELVLTTGIVTAVDSNGFYLQDPTGDGNDSTSEGIFVFTSSAPTINVGDAVQVDGFVSEFIPGGASSNNLSITQLTSPVVTVLSSGNTLPAAVILGEGGRIPPTQIIDNDAFATFDPAEDGIDFYESLEGMRLTVNDAVAVNATNEFGEIFAVAGGTPVTGLSDRSTVNISPNDFNPERIQIDDDSTLSPSSTPNVNVGDALGDVTGVVSYSFGNYEVLATADYTPTSAGLQKEVTNLTKTADQLTVVSYNVENLDPKIEDPALTDQTDGNFSDDVDDDTAKFDAIATQIANNLQLPDIIGLQEIQDNNGTEISDVTAANETLQLLVNKIAAISGVTYAYIDNPFIGNGTNGGAPGGNIRTAFLYNPSRVTLVEGSVQTITDPQQQQADSQQFSDYEPGRNPFLDSRLPLAATFQFNGQDVTVVSNHFTSKGGSVPLVGQVQPSVSDAPNAGQEDPTINGGVEQRRAQAEAVKGFVDGILSTDPNANVVVLGDLNEFEFISPLQILEQSLVNLTETLPENERYSYIFQGNSQSLDHILVSGNLATNGAEFDPVHVNSEFVDQASDHDPLLARLTIPRPINTINGSRKADTLTGTAGIDIITGFKGRDTLTGGGESDQFVYTSLRDRVDTITDFEVGSDKIVLTQLLADIGYQGNDAIADHYVNFRSCGSKTVVSIDKDGLGECPRSRSLVVVKNVGIDALKNSANFVF